MAKSTLKLVNSSGEISRQIAEAWKPVFNSVMQKAAKESNLEIRELLKRELLNTEEVRSLNNGQLRAEFGLVDGFARISRIIDIWAENVSVIASNAKIVRNMVNASFSLLYINTSYEDVLSSSEAVLVTEKGMSLEWLKWLIMDGDKSVIISGYNVSQELPRFSARSRTGTVIMLKNKRGRWSVPEKFKGTRDDNMVTRVTEGLGPQIINILGTNLERASR